MHFCNVYTVTCFTCFYSRHSPAAYKEHIYLHTAAKGQAVSVDRVVKAKAKNHKESLPSTETG